MASTDPKLFSSASRKMPVSELTGGWSLRRFSRVSAERCCSTRDA
jgi:hypothetical protein